MKKNHFQNVKSKHFKIIKSNQDWIGSDQKSCNLLFNSMFVLSQSINQLKEFFLLLLQSKMDDNNQKHLIPTRITLLLTKPSKQNKTKKIFDFIDNKNLFFCNTSQTADDYHQREWKGNIFVFFFLLFVLTTKTAIIIIIRSDHHRSTTVFFW